jgi:4-amino-4-deoxy-L-arabinose transferase-like glycosyltransferase
MFRGAAVTLFQQALPAYGLISGGPIEEMKVKDWSRHEGRITGGFIIVAGFLLFFNLWGRSLENHDYLRYAEVAREMIRSGDWIVPRYNGEVYLDKPPLLLWLIAIPSFIYGSVTPFIARFPSALSAWLGVLVLFLWGKKIYGSARSGIISAGILLSCYQYFSQARSAKTDMLLCLLILLSLYFFYLGYEETRKRRSFFYGLSFFFMGLGVLTKGPFGFFIPFPLLAAFLIKEKKSRVLISKEFIVGYLILLLTALPWVSLFIGRFGVDQSMALIKATHPLSRQAPFYFYLVEIWGQFFPWSLLLPLLGLSIWRERSKVWQSEESLFLIWFVLLFLFLTLFKVRVSRYLLPALPPLALMLGGRWRKNFAYFLVSFIVMISVWQIREMNWMKKDFQHSPGKLLAGELKPVIKEAILCGYQLDISTLEELNFYFDPATPILVIKKLESLSTHLEKERKGWVLMPKKIYETFQGQSPPSSIFIKEFQYKQGGVVLLSLGPERGS